MIEYINSISKVIMSKFEDSPIYIEGEPSDFIRPSFYINLVAGDNDELNNNLYMENATFQVIYFGELNDYNQPDVAKQLDAFSLLKGLFNKGYLSLIGDDKRVAKITNVTFDKRQGEIYIDLSIALPKVKDKDIEEYDIMDDVIVDIKK